MSTDPNEYGVPVIFDVTAYDREDAGRAIVEMLSQGRIVGRTFDTNGMGTATCQSWWTLEGVDKAADRNDNEHGVVVFEKDLDYLLALLQETRTTRGVDEVEQHDRLTAYFKPGARVGWVGWDRPETAGDE